jgi:hypothetical protein
MIEKYSIHLPKGGPEYQTTDAQFFEIPFVLLATAKRFSGKTCALTSFLRSLKEMDRLDRLFVISPTFENNRHYFQGLPVNEETDVLEPTIDTCAQLMEMVDEEGRLFDEYHIQMERWNELQKEIKNKKKHVNDIDEELLLSFPQMEKPSYKYMRNGKPYRPVCVAIFDDCMNTDLYSVSKRNLLSYMVIKHRHIGQTIYGKGSVGLNLLFSVQSYTSNAQGIPKSIRTNVTILLVFSTKCMKELKTIAEELAGEVSEDVFFRLHSEATSIPYGFLCVDLNKKKASLSSFRQNFNKYLYP